jgi:fucose 4-O-acetylase-like acetyltransferase
MAKRLEEFDLLKGIGILLVVLGHSRISAPLHYMIYSFHMPLFFMVSGFFYHSQPPLLYVKKTFSRLIVPWLFFVLLNVLFVSSLNIVATSSFTESISKTIKEIVPLDERCFLLYRSIWFLIVLFFIGNLYNLLTRLLNHNVLHIVVGLSYLGGYLLQRYINIPFFIDTSISVLLFYHAGAALKSVSYKHHKVGIEKISAVLFVLLMCATIWIKPGIDFKTNTFPIWCPFLSLPIIVSLYLIVRCYCQQSVANPVKTFLLRCGTYSLCVLGFHRLFQDVFFIIFEKLSINNATLQTSIYFTISVPLILLLSEKLRRYTPSLIGFKRESTN